MCSETRSYSPTGWIRKQPLATRDTVVHVAHPALDPRLPGHAAFWTDFVTSSCLRITANAEVSRQVTGIRQDAWANAHRIPVEEDPDSRIETR